MAEAFPNSEFFGFDYHDASIKRAREAAGEAGVEDRISFEVTSAKEYPAWRRGSRLWLSGPARLDWL
jgi:23S rRNA G2445 N2-methylase RlmL